MVVNAQVSMVTKEQRTPRNQNSPRLPTVDLFLQVLIHLREDHHSQRLSLLHNLSPSSSSRRRDSRRLAPILGRLLLVRLTVELGSPVVWLLHLDSSLVLVLNQPSSNLVSHKDIHLQLDSHSLDTSLRQGNLNKVSSLPLLVECSRGTSLAHPLREDFSLLVEASSPVPGYLRGRCSQHLRARPNLGNLVQLL